MKNNLRIGFCMLENAQKGILYNIVRVVIKLIFQDASDAMLDLCKLYKLHRLAFLAIYQARFVLESPFIINQQAKTLFYSIFPGSKNCKWTNK